ncbi:hypothetical protein MFLO_02578 [Listeria floridensis FSL S10-1187]|uniref:ABC transporter permease n=1 Tax=Listeria floridensis FSL S10-1187 TaxID=1265817 RepID=A0ABN0RHS2_9LIST|nr:hypothetical protein MFLO_02578 [Listeria floridensis FSL S10-1187]
MHFESHILYLKWLYIRLDTLFLKVSLFLIGLPILLLCLIAPLLLRLMELIMLNFTCFFIVVLGCCSIFCHFFQSFHLLIFIEQGVAFSNLPVLTLQKIKFNALIIAVLFAQIFLFYLLTDQADTLGILLIGLMIVFYFFCYCSALRLSC